jgi:hypothetical protein
MLKKIKFLDGHRWFIWTIVFIFVSMVGLAAYVYYAGMTDATDAGAPYVSTHRPAKIDYGMYSYVSLDKESEAINIISTNRWKQYQNKKSGFSFLYPNNFTVTEKANPTTGEINLSINPVDWHGQGYFSEAMSKNLIDLSVGVPDNSKESLESYAVPYSFDKINGVWLVEGRQGYNNVVNEIKGEGWYGLEATTTYEIESKDGTYGGTGYVYEAEIVNNENTKLAGFTMAEGSVSKDIFDTLVENFSFK